MFRKPPTSLRVNGKRYKINPDFRIFAKMEADAHKDRIDCVKVLKRFYRGNIPADVDAAVEKMIWFYQCGKNQDQKTTAKTEQRIGYDFEQDETELYQSFMRDYGIDLNAAKLHWWQFCKLCAGLSDDTPFKRLIYIRTVDTSKLPKEQRAAIMKAREQCRLEFDTQQPQTVEDYEAARIAELRKAYEEA